MCKLFNSILEDLDELRVRTLLSSAKPEDNPPTNNAAHFHVCRAFCQATKWLYAHKPKHIDLPSPVESGGFRLEDDKLVPIMMTTEPMPDALIEVTTCNCEADCLSRRCSCKKTELHCTVLCHKKLKFNHDRCANKSD